MLHDKKYQNLFAGIILLVGSIIILIFFVTIKPNYMIEMKDSHSNWAWAVLSLSSILYHLLISNGKKISGGYINPLFKVQMNFFSLIPIIGLVLSIINVRFVVESQLWANLLIVSYNFFKTLFLFLFLIQLSAGISRIKLFVSYKE